MCTVKTQKHCFPFITTSTIIPNDTRIHGHNAQWSEILDKCTDISSKHRQSTLFFNALSFCFDFSSFQSVYKNKNKLRTNWGWSSQKIKNNGPRQNLLVLIKKSVYFNIPRACGEGDHRFSATKIVCEWDRWTSKSFRNQKMKLPIACLILCLICGIDPFYVKVSSFRTKKERHY